MTSTPLILDLSAEEMQIFLAETDEQLQVLEEGLIRMERDAKDAPLLQALFRAAHTLKGSAGMVGHKPMVAVTHELETALDGVRKDKLTVTTTLTDMCLEALDVLQVMRNQIAGDEVGEILIDPVLARFAGLSNVEQAAPQKSKPQSKPANGKASGAAKPVAANAPTTVSAPAANVNGNYQVSADIAPDSIASAARAFQLMMALQELGEIVDMQPSQSTIESAAPVAHFKAELKSSKPLAEINKVLDAIAEVNNLTISGGQPQAAPNPAAVLTPEPVEVASVSEPEEEPVQAAEHIAADTPKTAQADAKANLNSRGQEKTVRASVERLDKLMNLVGELITDRNRLLQLRSELENAYQNIEQVEILSETVAHLGRITDQLQEQVMGIRMQPIATVFNKFPRLVRDLSLKLNKEVNLIMTGEETELDRSVIEKIGDPLIHLLRNAIDHGMETPEERLSAGKPRSGTIHLSARTESGQIILTVKDDGPGINAKKLRDAAVRKGVISESEAAQMNDNEAIDLIFRSGFTTAKNLSEVSGRGVGLDIVRNNIESLNGAVMVDSWPGQGTQFQLILPLTLAIVPTLLVRSANNKFAIPLVAVTSTMRIPVGDIHTIKTRPVILLRGNVLPIVHLNQALGLPDSNRTRTYYYIVAVRSGKSQIGLVVDSFIGEEEVMVKSLGMLSGKVPGISGGAILGDGQISLIIDIASLFKLVNGY